MYVYIQSKTSLWTVGFYDPKGIWMPESSHDLSDKAAERVNWLNGGHGERNKENEMSREEFEKYVMKTLKELHPDLQRAFHYYLKYLTR